MKSFLHDTVDVIDDIPLFAVLVGGMGAICLVGASLLYGSLGVDSLPTTMFWGGFTIIALGLLGMLVSIFVPPYLNLVSDGTVDLDKKDIRFYGRECKLHTLVIMWAYGVFLSYLSAVIVVGILLTVPFYVLIAFAGIAVTLMGLHYGFKMMFKVRNALKTHENDPNAHQKS